MGISYTTTFSFFPSFLLSFSVSIFLGFQFIIIIIIIIAIIIIIRYQEDFPKRKKKKKVCVKKSKYVSYLETKSETNHPYDGGEKKKTIPNSQTVTITHHTGIKTEQRAMVSS